MPTDIWKIPLDSDGAVRGSYYLRHKTDVSDTLGVVHFVNGRSVEPITGRPLVAFVAALGADVDLEPADDEAQRALWGDEAVPSAVADPGAQAVFVGQAQGDPLPEPETVSSAPTDPAPAPDADLTFVPDEKPQKRGKR